MAPATTGAGAPATGPVPAGTDPSANAAGVAGAMSRTNTQPYDAAADEDAADVPQDDTVSTVASHSYMSESFDAESHVSESVDEEYIQVHLPASRAAGDVSVSGPGGPGQSPESVGGPGTTLTASNLRQLAEQVRAHRHAVPAGRRGLTRGDAASAIRGCGGRACVCARRASQLRLTEDELSRLPSHNVDSGSLARFLAGLPHRKVAIAYDLEPARTKLRSPEPTRTRRVCACLRAHTADMWITGPVLGVGAWQLRLLHCKRRVRRRRGHHWS